jgi:hypothetical protein
VILLEQGLIIHPIKEMSELFSDFIQRTALKPTSASHEAKTG